jgi:uncharacterized protein YajQ (UPF0234 family)
MPQEFSFDVVSVVDLNVVADCVNVAAKEITNRFDFKDANASLDLDQKDKKIVVRAKDENRVEAAFDVLLNRLAKRNLPLKNFQKGKIDQALGQTARMEVKIQSGIPADKAREIAKAVKDAKIKANPAIQGDQLRVSGRSKDDLQAAITLLKAKDFGIALQFTNYR